MKADEHEKTARAIARATALKPRLGIVLGSGFHGVASALDVDTRLSYEKLPGFPVTRVPGHRGELLVGRLSGTEVAVLSGRSHYYEGRSMADVTFAVCVLAAWGIKDLLLTNAAGGINRRFVPGDFMVVRDHINLMGTNPLRGPVEGRKVFIDLTHAYDARLSEVLKLSARAAGVRLKSGVYLAVTGPSYETPAEIRAFARLGADAVGMSTVPEVIAARQRGLNVAALSCITNQAAGIGAGELSHDEVLETARRVEIMAADLLRNFVRLYAGSK